MSADTMHLKGEQGEEPKPDQGEKQIPLPIPDLPADALIILPVRQMVLFPGVILPVTIGRPSSIEAAQRAVREQLQLGMVDQSGIESFRPVMIWGK